MKFCSVNGKQQTELSITDRGLAYGDGLFTTAKIDNGNIVLLNKHLERLSQGADKLKLPLPDQHSLREQLVSIAKKFDKAVLKVMITAGSGGRGYSRTGLSVDDVNTIIMISDFPMQYQLMADEGITLGVSDQHIGTSPMLGGIKHLNRLEQVLLRAELDARTEDDLIVTDAQNNVIEAISSNVFYLLDGELCTPELLSAGVNGIIRQTIITHIPHIKVIETKLSQLDKVQSMFICNSLMGIIPVKSYNNRILATDAVVELQKQLKGLI